MWRVGGKVPLNVYEGDKPMFQCHTPEDAARVVALLSSADARDQNIRELALALKPFADAEIAWMNGGPPQEIRMDWMTAARELLARPDIRAVLK